MGKGEGQGEYEVGGDDGPGIHFNEKIMLGSRYKDKALVSTSLWR